MGQGEALRQLIVSQAVYLDLLRLTSLNAMRNIGVRIVMYGRLGGSSDMHHTHIGEADETNQLAAAEQTAAGRQWFCGHVYLDASSLSRSQPPINFGVSERRRIPAKWPRAKNQFIFTKT